MIAVDIFERGNEEFVHLIACSQPSLGESSFDSVEMTGLGGERSFWLAPRSSRCLVASWVYTDIIAAKRTPTLLPQRTTGTRKNLSTRPQTGAFVITLRFSSSV